MKARMNTETIGGTEVACSAMIMNGVMYMVGVGGMLELTKSNYTTRITFCEQNEYEVLGIKY